MQVDCARTTSTADDRVLDHLYVHYTHAHHPCVDLSCCITNNQCITQQLMSRLASFRGPSAPSSQPVPSSPQSPFPPFSTPRTPKKSKQNRQGSNTPSSPTPSSPHRDRRDSGLIQPPHRRKFTPQQGGTDATGKIKAAVDGPDDLLTQARRILLDIRGCAKRWNELVNEGSLYAKEIVDSRTRIE